MEFISHNIRCILDEVRKASAKANRNFSEVKIVAVTKTVSPERIKKAVDAGLKVLGENRVQELLEKYPLIPGVEWHLIGHLQSNKVKHITDKVKLIHSVDRLSVAEEINKRMLSLGKVMDVLVQVNVAEEATKFGVSTDETLDFIEVLSKFSGIKVRGLMTIAPYVPDPEEVRPVFRQLRALAEKVKTIGFPGVDMSHLSMGMSNDYRVAVEEGATLIRVGSAIFGQRDYN